MAWRDLLHEPVRFLRAALVNPVPRDHRESDAAFRRRRRVALATLLVGAGVLGFSLRTPPGDPAFYVGTIVLAFVWTVGAVLSGPLHLGRAHTRAGHSRARPVVQSAVLGVAAVLVFLAGSVVVARVPVLSGRVDAVLDYARAGPLAVVWLITVGNGLAEELYFRGALFAAVGSRHAVAVTTVLYALATVATGNVMLVFSAAVLGLLTGLQRRVTGGVLGPMVTHAIWSTGMLLLLTPTLEMLR